MFTASANNTTTDQLTTEVKKLSMEQQKILLMHLKKKEIYARAKAYDKANQPPKISTEEICDIVREVRKKMHK
jgi:hypothetical protein